MKLLNTNFRKYYNCDKILQKTSNKNSILSIKNSIYLFISLKSKIYLWKPKTNLIRIGKELIIKFRPSLKNIFVIFDSCFETEIQAVLTCSLYSNFLVFYANL